jgi:hypothetical protein
MSKVHIAYGVDAAEVQRSSFENDTVTAVTHGHGEQETGLAAADEQPKVTDEIDVETPAVEEKYSTVEEDRNGGVNTGGVGDDGRDSTGVGDGGASTGAEIRRELVMVELQRELGMMKNPVSKRRLKQLAMAKRKRLQYHQQQQLQLMSSQAAK